MNPVHIALATKWVSNDILGMGEQFYAASKAVIPLDKEKWPACNSA